MHTREQLYGWLPYDVTHAAALRDSHAQQVMLVGAEAQHMFELAQADLAKRVERLLVVARTIVTNAESNLTAAKSLTQVFGPLYALGLKRELTGAQERLEFLEDLAGRNTRPEACVLDPSSLEHDE